MKKFAKLINKTCVAYAPEDTPECSNFHLSEASCLAAGYNEIAPIPDKPEGNYRLTYELVNSKIIPSWEEIPDTRCYAELREPEYPDFRIYLDAMVKINSGDETAAADGRLQRKQYFDACWAVKQKYPKPALINPTPDERETNNESQTIA